MQKKHVFLNVTHSWWWVDVRMALLQAYGAAVVEEAPIFAISNYEVTFFCHRNLNDVRDRRIWASPPIARNSVSLPPRAAWLHFLAVAQECRTLRSKSLLLRNEVPSTPTSGYPVPLPSGETVRLNASTPNGHQTVGSRQQPAQRAKHATKRGAQASSLDMQVSSSSLTECAQAALSPWLNCLQHLPLGDAISELPWIKLDQVKLTTECLGSTSLARVIKVGHV